MRPRNENARIVAGVFVSAVIASPTNRSIVLVRCADETSVIACGVRHLAEHLTEVVDAFAADKSSRSIATGRDKHLEAARVTSHKSATRVVEVDN
jgi:hypothetical protein